MAKKRLGLLGLSQHLAALVAVLLTNGCGDSGHEFSTDGVLNDPLVSPASSLWLGSAQYTYTKTRKECWALAERQQNDPGAGAAPDLSWTISDGVECTKDRFGPER
ncbi:MAG: hypothetical protein AAF219_10730 [Myxococcota bacterium]